MNGDRLSQDVKEHAREMGAQLVGIADAERLAKAPKGHRPWDFVKRAKTVVVMGLPVLRAFATGYGHWLDGSEMVPETVDREAMGDKEVLSGPRRMTETFWPRAAINNHIWRRCTYEFLNMELQRLSFRVALLLQERGHEAIYMPTTYGSTFSWDQDFPKPNSMAPFCHRHAAAAAGLGEFGLSNMLMTREYGPLVRLVSVITTAEMAPDPLLTEPVCRGEQCGECRKTCPNQCYSEAIKEYDYGGVQVREFVFDAEKCGGYGRTRLPCTRQCWTRCPVAFRTRYADAPE